MEQQNQSNEKSQIIGILQEPISIASSDDCIEMKPQEYKAFQNINQEKSSTIILQQKFYLDFDLIYKKLHVQPVNKQAMLIVVILISKLMIFIKNE
ncbi:unnamed protein product [Paramecium pentaurelia]|uniref:Uncharacterized protein n=1 Tax=Paramecium pentaurelia TaxID=43138 RepID=A0A8S1X3C8_9CILI|nr:unnamed protein product [Paramecium pentaurelia]